VAYPESAKRKSWMTSLTAMFWSLVVLSIVVNNYADIAMKIQINDRLPAKEKFSWWSRNSWAVARKYGEFYPNSNMPLISQCSFWLAAALGAAFVINSLWKSN
jgi:hypothetical protein